MRDIPGSHYQDAIGCYPLFCCLDWSGLNQDLAELEGRLVSLALVTDPMGGFQFAEQQKGFDVCYLYKNHFVIDLSRPVESFVSKSHRKNALHALKKVVVEPCRDPIQHLDEWNNLYDSLVVRHKITGIRRFSREAFKVQLSIPGTVYFRIFYNGTPIGGDIFYIQDDVVHAHLAAFTDIGYRLDASYADIWMAIEYFKDKAGWMNLGGSAGISPASEDGLAYFKRGWSTNTRPVYFCGRIFDRERFSELAGKNPTAGSSYFPIYRAGEFS